MAVSDSICRCSFCVRVLGGGNGAVVRRLIVTAIVETIKKNRPHPPPSIL